MDSYSYVSLFGINSLDALKLSIFMEVIHKKHIGTKQDLDAVKSADKILSSLSRKAIGLFRALPYSVARPVPWTQDKTYAAAFS
jgi:hypothetical protein